MHTGLHSLAHRAPGTATRTRVRWQPYNSLPSVSTSVPSRSPSTTYINTPTTVSSLSPYSTPAFDSKSAPTPTPPLKDSQPPKNHKYALGLVDQAVKSLTEVWRPQDIPSVFLVATSSNGAKNDFIASHPTTSQLLVAPPRNTQLPSPVSPSTQPSPRSTSPDGTVSPCAQETSCMFGSRSNLVPIKGFVHEVLRRSRTSGCVLQTALCYLEAVKPKLPGLLQQAKSGQPMSEPDMESRVSLATAADYEQDALLTSMAEAEFAECGNISAVDTLMNTVKISSEDCPTAIVTDDSLNKFKVPCPPLVALPALPSPLLCPRRAFLAALIIASKFTQDKCYSNRAWAKLSGLPAREISRCERALGDALEWRFWVGKATSTATSPPVVTKPLARCQSEGNLRSPIKSAFLVKDDSGPTVIPVGNRLRRAATMPESAFTEPSCDRPMDCTVYITPPELQSLSMMPSDITQVQPPDYDHASQMYCPTELVNPNPPASFSPCPSLSYSPSSTESSDSDYTIQMSSFLDDNIPFNNGAIGSTGTDMWPWLDSLPTEQTFCQAYSSFSKPGVSLGKPSPDVPPPLTQVNGTLEAKIQGLCREYLHPNYPNLAANAGTLWTPLGNNLPAWAYAVQ